MINQNVRGINCVISLFQASSPISDTKLVWYLRCLVGLEYLPWLKSLEEAWYLYLNTGFDDAIIDCRADITTNPHSTDLGPWLLKRIRKWVGLQIDQVEPNARKSHTSTYTSAAWYLELDQKGSLWQKMEPWPSPLGHRKTQFGIVAARNTNTL